MHHRKTYMYINFQQNRVSSSIKTVLINIFAKNASCINLQLPIVVLKKSNVSDMHHRKTYMQGRSQDLGGGGVNNFFSDVGIARGVRGHAPTRNFFKTVQFGAF